MKKFGKQLFSWAMLLVFLLSFITETHALQGEQVLSNAANAPSLVMSNSENNFVMHGASGVTLLVKSIGVEEYEELTNILYPNGVIDEQGQVQDSIPNMEQVRAEYIASHTKAYVVNGNAQSEVTLVPFTISLEDISNGNFEALMYRCIIGTDTFIFPSEWGCHPFGFLHSADSTVYLAYTDVGIWRIDAINGGTEKITSDMYEGESRANIDAALKAKNSNKYLTWIDGAQIDSSGRYVVYRTNRDTATKGETSIWKVDLQTLSERRLVGPTVNNDIIGFVSSDSIVVGSLDNTRVISISSGRVESVDVPSLPNICVKAVGHGTLTYTTRQEGASLSTAVVAELDGQTGKLTEIKSVSGYLDGIPSFSPSGTKLAFTYGDNPETGVNSIRVVDTSSKTEMTVAKDSMSTQRSQTEGYFSKCLWLNDNILLTGCSESSVSSAATRSSYNVVFEDTPLKVVSFISPLSTGASGGFVAVNSKWNQPRSVGTNPHNGVDIHALVNTNVYAPYYGWSTKIQVVGNSDIEFLVDANRNQVKDDGDYYVRFYHTNSCEADGYKSQGQLIGKSGDQGTSAAHLHFGICSKIGGLKWRRNEPNYSYLASNKWASGKDLDIYSQAKWSNNTASLVAYIRDDGVKRDLAEVRIYYRGTQTGSWIDGGVMSKNGDVYSYNFKGIYPTGSNVYWMVRLTRTGISQAAFAPAKFFQPDNNPNASAYAYEYWVNTIT